jgi:VIT1/CCC1 family predicted Fe2+/Mn2+ transporter
MNDPKQDLHAMHTPDAIAERISGTASYNYIGDFVLGAIDGTVTTFAVVSGVAGAGLSAGVALVLGLANVLADGFSMAVGNYMKASADAQVVDRFRRMEERHIDEIPAAEREEIRQIFAAKGFDGDVLAEIVRVITSDRKRWVDTMLTDEWGLPLESPAPFKAAWTTFAAFLAAGIVPLVPLVLGSRLTPTQTFAASSVAAGLVFLSVGMLRGRVVGRPVVRSGIETVLMGGSAAAIAYFVGAWLKSLTGI